MVKFKSVEIVQRTYDGLLNVWALMKDPDVADGAAWFARRWQVVAVLDKYTVGEALDFYKDNKIDVSILPSKFRNAGTTTARA